MRNAASIAALLLAAQALAQAAGPIGNSVGEVRRIDKDANKITVAHEPIPEFQMRAMTMVLQAPDPAMIENLAVGDRIKFVVMRNGGAFTLQAVEVVRP